MITSSPANSSRNSKHSRVFGLPFGLSRRGFRRSSTREAISRGRSTRRSQRGHPGPPCSIAGRRNQADVHQRVRTDSWSRAFGTSQAHTTLPARTCSVRTAGSAPPVNAYRQRRATEDAEGPEDATTASAPGVTVSRRAGTCRHGGGSTRRAVRGGAGFRRAARHVAGIGART